MPRSTVAADTGYALGVVAAAFEFVYHMGDTLQAELAVVLGVEGVVGLDEGGEMVVEDKVQDMRPPRDIGGGVCGWDRGGSGEHMPKDSCKFRRASEQPEKHEDTARVGAFQVHL